MRTLSRVAACAALCFVLAAGSGCKSSGGWQTLFDGKSMKGWRASEHPDAVSVRDGALVCQGERAHVFYVGSDAEAPIYKDFEFQAEVKTSPGANSGIYVHTAYQDADWPRRGFEVQVNNTAKGEGDYIERKKTGSLYGVRNLYKQIVEDEEWFTMQILVSGRRIVTRVNGETVADYVTPEPAGAGRALTGGTFAIQCHDPGSRVAYRNIRVRPLPAGADLGPAPAPVQDAVYDQIMKLNASNFPLIDFHVHLKGGITLDQALAKSRETGINYGIAPNAGLHFPIQNDAQIYAFLDSLKGKPVFVGMQAEGREWVNMFSREAISRFDYVFTDAMTFTDDEGKRMRIWLDDEVGEIRDPQAFVDMYVDRIVKVLTNEPIDIYVNPTFLPTAIAKQYDALWTNARMDKVIAAAVQNKRAIEINNRYRIPSKAFLQRAKDAGVKFSCGTNNAGAELGRAEYCLEMIQALDLKPEHMFMPKNTRYLQGSVARN